MRVMLAIVSSSVLHLTACLGITKICSMSVSLPTKMLMLSYVRCGEHVEPAVTNECEWCKWCYWYGQSSWVWNVLDEAAMSGARGAAAIWADGSEWHISSIVMQRYHQRAYNCNHECSVLLYVVSATLPPTYSSRELIIFRNFLSI